PAAGALLLLLDHAGDQTQDLGRPDGAYGAGLERLTPVTDRALARELVEVRARHGQADLGVRRDVLGDLRARHLDPEQLDVAATAQLQLHDELELLQRGHLLLEVRDAL